MRGFFLLNKILCEINRKDEVTTPALPAGGVTNNNVFIGSTTDLQRMLAQVAHEEKVIDISDSTDVVDKD